MPSSAVREKFFIASPPPPILPREARCARVYLYIPKCIYYVRRKGTPRRADADSCTQRFIIGDPGII